MNFDPVRERMLKRDINEIQCEKQQKKYNYKYSIYITYVCFTHVLFYSYLI